MLYIYIYINIQTRNIKQKYSTNIHVKPNRIKKQN